MANEKRCRTQLVILVIYDALAEVMQTGKAYQTRLAPHPVDSTFCIRRSKNM